jgi:hypothetical protein
MPKVNRVNESRKPPNRNQSRKADRRLSRIEENIRSVAVSLESAARKLNLIVELSSIGLDPSSTPNEAKSPFSLMGPTNGLPISESRNPEALVKSLLKAHRRRALREPVSITVSPKDYAVMRTWYSLKAETKRDRLKAGHFGVLWGVDVRVKPGISRTIVE